MELELKLNMNRNICLLIFLFFGMNVFAQQRSTLDKFNFEFKTIFGLKQHDIMPINLDMQLSFEFAKNWSVLATIEGNRLLMKKEGNKNYADAISLGGGLGYVLYNGTSDRFNLRFQVLTSINSSDLNHTIYDIGTMWFGRPSKHRISPLMGLGFRHQKSRLVDISDWNSFYATIGICF